MLALEDYCKKHEYIICIDSDGTMIDAMNVKHRKCHGASLIEEWGLQEHQEEVQKIWDSINLFEKSRGVNRFIALAEALKRLDGKYLSLDKQDYQNYCDWVEKGKITNKDLVAEIEKTDSPLMKKAYAWSLALNEKIAAVTCEEKPPFENGREALQYAMGKADIAIVSSSNMAAIVEEWKAYDLLQYVSLITSQEVGSKSQCLKALIAKGYDPEHILMIGDAYPDVDAARDNGVYYYPILTRHEAESWQEFIDKYFDIFVSGEFEAVQQELLDRFENNFDKH